MNYSNPVDAVPDVSLETRLIITENQCVVVDDNTRTLCDWLADQEKKSWMLNAACVSIPRHTCGSAMHSDVPNLPTILAYPFRQASPKMQGNHKLLLDLLQIRRYPGFEKKMWMRGPHGGKDLRHCAKQPNSKEPFSGHHLRLNHYTRSIRDFEIKLNTHRLNTDKYRVTPSTGALHKSWTRDLNEVVDQAAAALRCELYTEGNTLLAKKTEPERGSRSSCQGKG